MRAKVVRTPLIDAVMEGDHKAVRSLLAAGVDVDGVCEQNDTALAYAVTGGDDEMVRLLVQAGADLEVRRGVVALQTLKRQTPVAARLFAEYGFDWGMDGARQDPPKFGEYRHAIFYALANHGGWGDHPAWALEFLVREQGVSLDVLNRGDEMTALQYAATSTLDPAEDLRHSVCRLIEMGADPLQLLGVPLDEMLPQQVVEFTMAAIASGEIAKNMNSELKNVYTNSDGVHNFDEGAYLTGISESSISRRATGLMI